jgi:curli biogenesis system outer membrane secretion channel CsgG
MILKYLVRVMLRAMASTTTRSCLAPKAVAVKRAAIAAEAGHQRETISAVCQFECAQADGMVNMGQVAAHDSLRPEVGLQMMAY